MKIKNLIAAAALVAGLGYSASASAALVAYNDVFNAGPNGTSVTFGAPLSWQHNINDSLNVGNDLIQTATLSIVLLDPAAGNETVQINIDLTGFVTLATNVNNGGNAVTFDTNLSNLQITTLLQTDGLLDVTLRAANSGENITVQSSTLSGIADTGAIPEPATLAVLGMGLLGLGAVRRRKA